MVLLLLRCGLNVDVVMVSLLYCPRLFECCVSSNDCGYNCGMERAIATHAITPKTAPERLVMRHLGVLTGGSMLGADTLEERDNLDLPTVRSSLPILQRVGRSTQISCRLS